MNKANDDKLQKAETKSEKQFSFSALLSCLSQILKKSCIEILVAEPSSICAGGKTPIWSLNGSSYYTHKVYWNYLF